MTARGSAGLRGSLRQAVRAGWLVTTAVAVLAFVVRLRLVTQGGGLHGLQGYDDGVYYTAADAWIHGRWPYRDFLLLHPPGVVVALAPFALLGRATSDATGLALARLAFMAIGALSCALVHRLARRCGPVAGVIAALTYAAWYPAAYSDRVTLIEPLGTATVLVALVLLRRGAGPRAQALAGVALGACLSTKIWSVVPVLVVLGWQLLVAGRASLQRLLIAAGSTAAVIYLPFVVAAPRQLVRMVVLDQVGRPAKVPSRVDRIPTMTGASRFASSLGEGTLRWVSVVVAIVLVLSAVVALLTATSRLWGVLFVACAAVLVAAPSHYVHYGGFVAGPLALVVGAAVARAAGDPRSRSRTSAVRRWGVGAPAVVALLALAVSTATVRTGQPFPGPRFGGLAADRPCVVADDPTALALMDVLSRDLADGCRLEVDVSGASYAGNAVVGPDGLAVARPQNERYQRHVYGYLTSGSATVLARRTGNGFSPATRRRLSRLPLLSRAEGASLYGRARQDSNLQPAD